MNARQKHFCEAYAWNPNATQAAKEAGYSAKTARSIGAENLTKPDIVEYIHRLQAETECERIANIQEIMAFWTDIIRDAECKIDARLKASELLAKAGAAFINRVEVDADVQTEMNDVVIYLPDNGRSVITDIEEPE